jgi:hypothetical protein
MDRLEEALIVFGEAYIEEVGKILRSEDKFASGDLLRSLDTQVFKTGFGTSYTLKVVAEEYLKYVDEGRRAGAKPPPVKPIKEWAKQKGLDEGLAYPIAKSIGEKGIKPINVIERALNKALKSIEYRQLEDGVSDWVDDLITDRFKGLSKNKNITFK